MENLSVVESIFFAALDQASAEERAAYLDKACGQDQNLRHRVERLLSAHPKVGPFLQAPAPGVATIDAAPAAEGPGTRLGPYKLLEKLGEGGMGTVYMAEQQEPVRRMVALKLIKPGMDSSQVIARFEAERQSLALMDHPNIARVLDADSTDAGRPYFVMELVKGVPITDFCNERRLGPRERLELFVPVCRAIQHAHQKGVIHRDLKPSNVLVALYDGRPVPKVIDFGVAKAVGQKLTERTLFTGFGALVGTLEYMSPEQAELNQLDIDTRSDVYSLGVLLYELLTGSTPLGRERLKEAALLEVLRRIREEEPPRPSTHLTTSQRLASVSALRGMEPSKLTRLIRGELDWIVMKALEKDRNRRYESANGLAMDIERHLMDERVEACPPSLGYKLKKFVRRHKKGLAAIAMIMVLLFLATMLTTYQAVRARQAEMMAVEQQHRVMQALEEAEAQRRATEKARETGKAAVMEVIPGVRNAATLLDKAIKERDKAVEEKNQALKEAAALRKEIETLRGAQKKSK
jgi:serine/threonine protein kinase